MAEAAAKANGGNSANVTRDTLTTLVSSLWSSWSGCLQEQTSQRHDILAEQVDKAILAEQVHKFSTANRSRFFCDLCFMDMHSAARLVYHKLGPRHCARAAFVACPPDPLLDFWCEVCCLDMQSDRALRRHQGGRRHLNQATRAFVYASGEEKDRRVFLT